MATDLHRAAIERELRGVKTAAGAPRELRLGCTRVSHDRLGFCSACELTVDRLEGSLPLELLGWRLLALREALDG